jgi:hypothetical protein
MLKDTNVIYLTDEEIELYDYDINYPYITLDTELYKIKEADSQGMKLIKVKVS